MTSGSQDADTPWTQSRWAGLVGLGMVLVGVFAVRAWRFAFLCDDAYISFRFARNLLMGHGLVFNAGDPVEGYTNFLWVLQLAAAWRLGVHPEISAHLMTAACTAGMVAMVVHLAWTTAARQHRDTAVLLVLLFMAVNRSLAVWSTSGLETRQFTLLILLAIGALRAGGMWLVVASLCLGLAELTRPDALLLWGCAVLWFVVEQVRRAGRPQPLHIAWLTGPFVAISLGHLAFRMGYYGDVLPNTWYAKVTEPWPEAGLVYLATALLEHGGVVLLPIAAIGGWSRWRRGDSLHLLSALLILPYVGYVVRIGGDHFEYRMLDLAFVLIHLAAADGVIAVRDWVATRSRPPGAELATAALAALCVGYSAALPSAQLRANHGLVTRHQTKGLHKDLLPEHAPWLFRLPLVSPIAATWNDLRRWSAPRMVASRHREHAAFWRHRRAQWSPYSRRDLTPLPEHLVTAEGAIGVMSFFLPEVRIVDAFGLTDRVVARNDQLREGLFRQLAHRRQPPEGYLVKAGVNLWIMPAASSPSEAHAVADIAVRLAKDLWMPVEMIGEGELFGDLRVVAGRPILPEHPSHIPIVMGERALLPTEALWGFEHRNTPGWIRSGSAFENQPSQGARGSDQDDVSGFVGDGLVNSFHPVEGDRATGSMVSIPFVPHDDDFLGFYIGGGGERHDMGVALIGPGGVVRTWNGPGRERLELVGMSLRGLGGVRLRVEIFDRSAEDWGHILADHFMLMRPWERAEVR